MAARFADHPEAVAESRRLADRLRFDLRADLGYRYPGSEDAGGRPRAGAGLRARRSRSATRPATATATQALRRARGGAARSSPRLASRASSSCTATCSSSRARWRSRSAGPDTARALLPPGRGRGSSVSSIVCYLTGLSHVDPIENELLLGRFLNEEITSLPDIDLDFPRDIREALFPRIHERYGRERSAIIAAFPTYRARGAIRELGKALGLPPGEIERVARGSEGWSGREVERDVIAALGERRARGRALGAPDPAGGRGARPAAPPLPALGRDGGLHPPAGRLLPGRARGDRGPPARPVGQGLLRGRGLPEDRPARAGDALGRRALRGADRGAVGASASISPGSPTTTPNLFRDPARRDRRRLPDREPRADGLAASNAPRDPRRSDRPGGDRAPRADPGRRGQPLHRAPPAPARGP